jgi:hypothetical protein
MRRILVFALLSFFPACVFGQPSPIPTRADTVFNSISPIVWDFEISCEGGGMDGIPQWYTTYQWTGSIGAGVEDFYPEFDSVTTAGDTFTFFTSNFPFATSISEELVLTLDTVNRKISMSYEYMNDPESSTSEFGFSNLPFTYSGSIIQAAVICGDSGCGASYIGPTAKGRAWGSTISTGWVTIGGASVPSQSASVSTTKTSQVSSFSATLLSNNYTCFNLPVHLESPLQIFDLMGRKRVEITVEPEVRSINFNPSQLSPGIYVATLDGNATKFAVP